MSLERTGPDKMNQEEKQVDLYKFEARVNDTLPQNFKNYTLYKCVGGTVALKQKSEDNLQDTVLSRYHVVPGIKPGPSNLGRSTFTYGATLPAPAALSYRWILTLPSQLDPQAIPIFCRKKKNVCFQFSDLHGQCLKPSLSLWAW